MKHNDSKNETIKNNGEEEVVLRPTTYYVNPKIHSLRAPQNRPKGIGKLYTDVFEDEN